MNILLIAGGSSEEREISKRTSAAVYKALLNNQHTVTVFDPALQEPLIASAGTYFSTEGGGIASSENYTGAFDRLPGNVYDLAFIGLHGQYGEDGIVQALLELKKIPYTGSGVMSSALAMDKHAAKLVMESVGGVDVPSGFIAGKNDSLKSIIENCMEITGFPVVVKPNDQGSTVGLSICNTPDELAAAHTLALKHSKTAIYEEFIPGRELTAGIVEGWELPIIEIKPKHDLYDYECKYTKGMTEYLVPADLPEELAAEILSASQIAFQALGCKGYARADFRLTPDGRFSCLEVNTLPGMTETSLLPKMAAAKGYSFDMLVEKIVQLAIK